MISEPHRNLRADPQRWGAESVVTVIAHRGRTVTFQVRPSSQHPTSKSAFSNLSRVASFRSQRRLAQRRNGELRVTSLLAVLSNVLVASSSAGLHHRLQFRGFPLPNNTLVPTAQTLSRLGSRSVAAPAAQRGR